MLFDGEKPALLQQIDAEFEKVQGQKPPAPTRGLKSSSGAVEDDEDEDAEEEEGGINVADLVPRTDIR
jgi:cytoskeleton-associated protein 5